MSTRASSSRQEQKAFYCNDCKADYYDWKIYKDHIFKIHGSSNSSKRQETPKSSKSPTTLLSKSSQKSKKKIFETPAKINFRTPKNPTSSHQDKDMSNTEDTPKSSKSRKHSRKDSIASVKNTTTPGLDEENELRRQTRSSNKLLLEQYGIQECYIDVGRPVQSPLPEDIEDDQMEVTCDFEIVVEYFELENYVNEKDAKIEGNRTELMQAEINTETNEIEKEAEDATGSSMNNDRPESLILQDDDAISTALDDKRNEEDENQLASTSSTNEVSHEEVHASTDDFQSPKKTSSSSTTDAMPIDRGHDETVSEPRTIKATIADGLSTPENGHVINLEDHLAPKEVHRQTYDVIQEPMDNQDDPMEQDHQIGSSRTIPIDEQRRILGARRNSFVVKVEPDDDDVIALDPPTTGPDAMLAIPSTMELNQGPPIFMPSSFMQPPSFMPTNFMPDPNFMPPMTSSFMPSHPWNIPVVQEPIPDDLQEIEINIEPIDFTDIELIKSFTYFMCMECSNAGMIRRFKFRRQLLDHMEKDHYNSEDDVEPEYY